jgi:hypothetical protein
MKRAVKAAWGLGVPAALAVLFLFFLVAPARAPSGGKLWTGGRTIASLQEDDFDRRLLKLQLCYGVSLTADQCTAERRRVCKAFVLHEVETALTGQGAYLRIPVEFRCEDTAAGKFLSDAEDFTDLRPNAEVSAIQRALESSLVPGNSNAQGKNLAGEACEFITDCKWAMRAPSLRKLAGCLTTGNATHRKILFSEMAAMLFGGKAGWRGPLYPQLVESLK